MKRSSRQGGFTLLEVMIALAIMAVALSALLGHEGVAVQMSDYSNRVSQANLLAYGKLLDLEHKLINDSIDVLDNCEDGDFRDEGFRRFTWKGCAFKLEIAEGAEESIAEQVLSGIAGAFGVNLANPDGMTQDQQKQLGQLQQMVAAIPYFMRKLEDKVRKVRLEVTWRDMLEDRMIIVERYVTLLGVNSGGRPPPADGRAEPVPGSEVATPPSPTSILSPLSGSKR